MTSFGDQEVISQEGPITSAQSDEASEDQALTVSQLFQLQEARGLDSFLVEGLIPLGSLVSLSGDPKKGKSVLVNNLAVCVALGKPWLGKAVKQGPVVWYAFEESLEERANILRHYEGIEELPLVTVLARTPVNREAGYSLLEQRIKEIRPKLVVIDPLVAAFGDVDFNDQSQTRMALKRLKALCNDHGIVVILIHHLRKDASAGPLDRNRTAGSAQIMATCSADWILKTEEKKGVRTFRIRVTGRMIGQTELVVRSTAVTDFSLVKEGSEVATGRANSSLEDLIRLVREGSPRVFGRKELRDVYGHSDSTLDRNMRLLGELQGFHRLERKGVWFDGKEEGDYNPFENES